MDQIFVVNNFLSANECEFYINYINNNLDKLTFSEQAKRWQITMGIDNIPGSNSPRTLDPISDIEPEVRSLFRLTEEKAKELYSVGELYVSNFFLTKQGPGATIPMHYDQDGGDNPHCTYSGVFYLNDMLVDGFLDFTEFNYTVKQKAGDLVLFPSTELYTHQVKSISQDRYALPIFLTNNVAFKL